MLPERYRSTRPVPKRAAPRGRDTRRGPSSGRRRRARRGRSGGAARGARGGAARRTHGDGTGGVRLGAAWRSDSRAGAVRGGVRIGGRAGARREEGPETLRTGSVPSAASAEFRCLLGVRARPGSNPPPGRGAPPRRIDDTAPGCSGGSHPAACAGSDDVENDRPASPVLDWAANYRPQLRCQPSPYQGKQHFSLSWGLRSGRARAVYGPDQSKERGRRTGTPYRSLGADHGAAGRGARRARTVGRGPVWTTPRVRVARVRAT
ncbi:hypothetical protein SAMN05421505_118124 [Sinosporangium album]|uniref:Uncharacterized protein n=1 Tax=Sinosporangium album TaxID=504805 RepID=A0A1G8DP89_9ACTN|nr:hypothetical protein SAMN05421505_118124 [Sinosporangium album]